MKTKLPGSGLSLGNQFKRRFFAGQDLRPSRFGYLTSFGSVLKSLYLFPCNDLQTMILPVTCLGVFGAVSGGYSDTSEPSWASIFRTPQTFIWVWCNVLLFSISNQRSQKSILEDSINKPWRPLPSGRITSAQARFLLLLGIPIFVVICYAFLGAVQETILCLLLTWMYNDLGGADEHFLLRNGINSLAYMVYGCGAVRVAIGTEIDGKEYILGGRALEWLGVISAIIFTTMQVQDLKDQEGDRATSRSTVPLDLGDRFCRWTVAVGVLGWSFIVSRYWSLGLFELASPAYLGLLVACRVLVWHGPSADSKTYKYWSIWLISIFSLPILKHLRHWMIFRVLSQSSAVLQDPTRFFPFTELPYLTDSTASQLSYHVKQTFLGSSFCLYLSLALGAYLVLVRLLRYRQVSYHYKLLREQQLHNAKTMSIPVAQKIYSSLFDHEFPFMFMKGIQLALFRTYAIPTISSLLMEKGRLASSTKIARRYAETEVLFLEFALREWGSVPWLQATARTRAIHARWREVGLASEEDMLYTLAALATQPVELVERWEWRRLTDVELCAVGTLYRGIADAMGINYAAILSLPNSAPTCRPPDEIDCVKHSSRVELNHTAISDGLMFFNSLRTWQSSYELRVMTYTERAHHLAEIAIEFLLWGVPGKAFKSLGAAVLASLMDPHLRSAVGYDAPFVVATLTTGLLRLRQFLLRHFCLPRFFRIRRTTDHLATGASHTKPFSCVIAPRFNNKSSPNMREKSKSSGRLPRSKTQQGNRKSSMMSYTGAPYFVSPTLWNRWGLGAWWWWALGLPLPGDKADDGGTYESGGYDIPLLGPNIGKGIESQKREENAVKAVASANRWN